MSHKIIALGIILLFISCSIPNVSADDTTPPTTFLSSDPTVPTGINGWYICPVEITLIATDNESGVNQTLYRINNDTWIVYTEPFVLDSDKWYFIEFYSVDNAGNKEIIQGITYLIDQTEPEIDLTWEAVGGHSNDIIFTATCKDSTSGMDRVEFFLDDKLQYIDDIVPYEWIYTLNLNLSKEWHVGGLIYFKEMTVTTISVYAFFVVITEWTENAELPNICATAYDIAGNSATDCISHPEVQSYEFTFLFLQPLTLVNNYTGSITRFRIYADFTQNPIWGG